MLTILNNKKSGVDQIVAAMSLFIQEELSPASGRQQDKGMGIRRLSLEVPSQSLLPWLEEQRAGLKIYWADREERFAVAGIGATDHSKSWHASGTEGLLARLHQRLQNTDAGVRYYGGFRFDPAQKRAEEWEEFGDSFFVLPRFELQRQGERSFFVCNLLPGEDRPQLAKILSELHSLNFQEKKVEHGTARLISRKDSPAFDGWSANIREALNGFATGSLEKIVLARKSELRFSSRLKPFTILKRLQTTGEHCFHFCFQPEGKSAFIGASPERLYFRRGKRVETEALAGTRPRGRSAGEDDSYGRELLFSEKDVREHRYVIDSIVEQLEPLSISALSTAVRQPELLKLARIQHLVSRLNLELKESVGDYDLLKVLHPTAAVGGYPPAKAVAEISRLEGFDRGWYAAPVGWISSREAEFAVAIRSALVKGTSLNLYAGAGIVQGSAAASEWQEIENKLGNFLKVLS